jgi:hypothetical protein
MTTNDDDRRARHVPAPGDMGAILGGNGSAKDLIVEKAKQMIAEKKQELDARQHGTGYIDPEGV